MVVKKYDDLVCKRYVARNEYSRYSYFRSEFVYLFNRLFLSIIRDNIKIITLVSYTVNAAKAISYRISSRTSSVRASK